MNGDCIDDCFQLLEIQGISGRGRYSLTDVMDLDTNSNNIKNVMQWRDEERIVDHFIVVLSRSGPI